MPSTLLTPSRRFFLASAATMVAWASQPRAAFAGTRDPRLVVVILRGALDGLAVAPPVGDPNYASLRTDLAIGADGTEVLPLDGFFALNDAMPFLHGRYTAKEAAIIQATATPYRDRSHFDGQDVLESGMGGPRATDSGWLNRLAAALPAGAAVAPAPGLAIGPTVPLILRGAAPTLTWSPPYFTSAAADTVNRLAALYGERDAALARVLAEGVEIDMLAGPGTPAKGGGTIAAFRATAEGAARLLADERGPRIAALSFDGWDTHANEGADKGRLANQLAALDAALETLASTLGPAVWQDTVVIVATEFGRTAQANGNVGTDHGTATLALLVGGAVRGGRVLADWPGLREADLYEARDLKPTTDLRAVFKGVLRDHLGVDERTLANGIFPDSLGVRPLDGLVA
jgi:uncharacterized protein (DUF1501 family)